MSDDILSPTEQQTNAQPAPAAAPQQKPARRVIPELIIEAMEKGLTVKINKDGYGIDGFYRSGTIDLEAGDGSVLTARSRRNKVDKIATYDDLVRLNYYWWCQSREKEKEWSRPGKEWLDDFIRLDLVEREVVFKPKVAISE